VTDPAAVVTITGCIPSVPAGIVNTCVVLVFAPSVALTPPTVIEVTPVRLVPVMVSMAPPESAEEVMLIAETVGVAANVGLVEMVVRKVERTTKTSDLAVLAMVKCLAITLPDLCTR
jgi:hypothetical protein